MTDTINDMQTAEIRGKHICEECQEVVELATETETGWVCRECSPPVDD